ncbi:MAG: hypothetical protein PWP63_1527 [Methanolobus sp.]|nr:hypothetical protein [Methanolobus sp.]
MRAACASWLCKGRMFLLEYRLYITEETDAVSVGSYEALLEGIREKHGVRYEIIDLAMLEDKEREELAEAIRLVSRRNSIGVVSKGGGALPISRNKKVSKHGILLRLEDGRLKDVYPHEMNKKRMEIASHLNSLLRASELNEAIGQESVSEQDISRMISTFPGMIEPGLKFVDTEIEVSGGRIDAVFTDERGDHLLVEIEIEARDNAIGQVQRFRIPYAQEYDIPADRIRLGIVCARIAESRLNACKGAGIEVYTLALERKA